jgi:group I intron endonuclease
MNVAEERSTWIVYCHTCSLTGKSYVGYTKKTLEQRWNEHVALAFDARTSKKKYQFNKAIQKYGVEAWSHEVIQKDLGSLEHACEVEKRLIAERNTLTPTGYNEIEGGRGVKLTAEGKDRHRVAIKAALHRPDVRARYLEGIRRSHCTPEFIARNKAAQKIAQNRPEVIALKRKSMLERANQPGYVGPRAKAVEQIEPSTGAIVATFDSVTQASKVTGINLSKITEVARGSRKRSGGFNWRYVSNDRINHV